MGPGPDISIALIALAPLLAALVAPVVRAFTGGRAGWVLAVVPVAVFVSLLGFVPAIETGAAVRGGLDWARSYGIRFAFLVDALSLAFGLLISGVGALVLIHSGGDLERHPHQGRFLALALMGMGALLGVVFADDLMTLFAFWMLWAGAVFLLAGFEHARQGARRAAVRALCVLGGGGFVLFAGLLLLALASGQTTLWGVLGSAEAVRADALGVAVLILVVVGALAASAQFPFQFWLTGLAVTPMPVLALVGAPGATVGIYLLMRLSPVLGGGGGWFWILTISGGVTLLAGGVLALRQTDLRPMLAYGALAGLGSAVVLTGAGATGAALLYLVLHAGAIAALAMIVGLLDKGTGTREVTRLGGLRETMPVTFIAALLVALTIAGAPVSLGVFAIQRAAMEAHAGTLVLALLGNGLVLAVGLTIALKPFLGNPHALPRAPREGAPGMLLGPVLLGICGVCVGLFGAEAGRVLSPSGEPLAMSLDIGGPAVWGVLVVWAIGGGLYWKADAVRGALRRAQPGMGWMVEGGFGALNGVARGADALLDRGGRNLPAMALIALAVLLWVPLLVSGAVPGPAFETERVVWEWGVLLLVPVVLLGVLVAREPQAGAFMAGAGGIVLAVVFLVSGAPGIALIQIVAAVLAILGLGWVARYRGTRPMRSRDFEARLGHGAIAAAAGSGVTLVLLAVLGTEAEPPVWGGEGDGPLMAFRSIDGLGMTAGVIAAGLAVSAVIVRGGKARAAGREEG